MSKLASLSDADIQSIADAVNNPTAATTTPVPTPTPTPTPTPSVDGAALYTANCAGCHGALVTSSKAGVTLARLQTAIANNTGNMSFLSTLTSVQQQAIVTALAPATTTPTPTPTPTPVTDGATLYATDCAGCHGALATSAKAGATAARIQTAISNNTGGMGTLSSLSTTQVAAIASSLAGVTATPTPAPACGSCHSIPPATGKHAKHTSQNIGCATCHGTGYSATTFNVATHNNGVKNLTTTIGWNTTSRSCANSCHGSRSW
jgi:mono/diheme cytochrome c family protein